MWSEASPRAALGAGSCRVAALLGWHCLPAASQAVPALALKRAQAAAAKHLDQMCQPGGAGGEGETPAVGQRPWQAEASLAQPHGETGM